MNAVNVSRRRFLGSTAVVGGGLVMGFSLGGCSRSALPIDAADGAVLNAFLQITPANVIRFYCPRDEMGQGVTTGLATLIAEELDVNPADLAIEFAGVHPDYANPAFRVQGTGGSTSMKAHYLPLRQVAANTRAVLIEAAAADLSVPAAQIRTEEGHIVVDAKRYPYGAFVATAAALTPPDAAPLRNPSEFRYIGREFPRLDGVGKATGTTVYGIDVDIPGMHHAVVRRSPVAGSRVKAFDRSKAAQLPGVTDVIEISSGVAVVAEKYWQAKTAAATLDIDWEDVPLAHVDDAAVRRDYEAALSADDGVVGPDEGDVQAGFDAAATVVENQYWTPFLAHAPLEPMNAVVRLGSGEAEVWSGTQSIQAARGLVARVSAIDPEKIRAHNTYLGGGFGRRSTLTHVVEATESAMATGKPIHVLWSREDDLKNGVYRPASLMRIRAGVDASGNVVAWDARRVGGNITPTTLKNALPALLPSLPQRPIDWMTGLAEDVFASWIVDSSSIEGLGEGYDFRNLKVTHTTVDHGIPLTFWRSVGHSYTAFAKESMIDELALAADADPVEFRLANTRGNPRLQNVIRVAGEHMKTMRTAPGRHLGFAAHGSFATDVAEIAEVSVDGDRIRVHKVVCVVDCGTAVNPDVIRAQMEGAVMFGLTAALHGELNLDNGAFRESNFHDYPILRMNEAPEVEVIIVDSSSPPTGVGEPGLPPIAPAVANAVYRATGRRLTSLPLTLGV